MGAEPMEEEELGKSTVWAKLFLGPKFKVGVSEGFSFFRKVELSDKTIDPDIDGKRIGPAVRIEEDASGDFWADAGQGFEMSGGLGCGKGVENGK